MAPRQRKPENRDLPQGLRIIRNFSHQIHRVYDVRHAENVQLPKEERPTFHEIRALAAKMFKDIGVSPSARMAHANEKTTEIYTENHVKWTRVPAAEIKVF